MVRRGRCACVRVSARRPTLADVIVKQDAVYVRRRRAALVGAVAVVVLLALLVWLLVRLVGGDDASASPRAGQGAASPATTAAAPKQVEKAAPKVDPATAQGAEAAPRDSAMVRIQRITGGLTPKSVVASAQGHVFAQNMMYSHTVTAYDAGGARVKTISDEVDLGAYGVQGHPGTSKGAPVEMAFSPDGTTAWVSNYAMYGPNFSPEGEDACVSGDGISNSYLYEIDTSSYEIERVVEVGAVPKYVAVTPDGAQVLVTNWCTMDLTVVDAATAKVTKTIPLDGRHPRGIAVTPDSKTAFVAIMGSDRTVEVDLAKGEVAPFVETGRNPRHLVMSPDGAYLYVTNSGSDTVTKVDARSGQVVKEVAVGRDPRSMAISPDGQALYVVDYGSASVTKIRAAEMSVVQTESTDQVPIGITYEPTKKRVWVACYNGSIIVFDDARRAA